MKSVDTRNCLIGFGYNGKLERQRNRYAYKTNVKNVGLWLVGVTFSDNWGCFTDGNAWGIGGTKMGRKL